VTDALRRLPVRGKRVLDVGCRDGLFSFEAERQGASEVIGIDNDLSPAAVEFLIPHFASRVKMHAMNVLDLRPDDFGKFDLVIFAGVLYHLRYPFHALRLLRDVMNDGAVLLLETALYTVHEDAPLLYCPVGSEGPYEATSVTFFNLKGLTATLRSFGINVCSTHYLNGHTAPIDRCTIVCEFHTALIDEDLRRYWDNTHELSSNFEAGEEFLLKRHPDRRDSFVRTIRDSSGFEPGKP
jgi:SAM-dependent methyltransferase